jgi:hypothetical protein
MTDAPWLYPLQRGTAGLLILVAMAAVAWWQFARVRKENDDSSDSKMD